jgi:hypothetical protein
MAHFRSSSLIKIAAAVVVAVALIFFAVRFVTGQSLGLRSSAYMILAVLDSQQVRSESRGQYTNIVFLHHSVGEGLIAQGRLRQRFSDAGYALWDQGYNSQQLRAPNGKTTGYGYYVPDDNTDPDGLAQIFAQPVYALPINTFSGLLQHEVIIFKSCFPVSDIATDEQLERYKTFYLGIRDVMTKHPDKVFIVLTPPPLNPAETNAANAKRARAFANWLRSDEFWNKKSKFFVFDLFEAFAESNSVSPDYSMLRQAYRDGSDSHPNAKANETVAPLLVDFVRTSIQTYRTGNSIGTQQ